MDLLVLSFVIAITGLAVVLALPCCGGHGTSHAAGCKLDPMFIGGQQLAMERE